MQYIALLRGINVGKKQVKMDRLKAIFEEMGFAAARTYIQTGNVLFDAPERDAAALRGRIEEGLQAALGFSVEVILLTRGELEHTLMANPFAGRALTENERVYVTFLAGEPAPEAAEKPATHGLRRVQRQSVPAAPRGRASVGRPARKFRRSAASSAAVA